MPFEKGKSGNPGGRKKERDWEKALRMELAEAGDSSKELRIIARNLIRLCKEESKDALPAIKELGDRLDGKVPQGIIGGDDGDNPVNVLQTIVREIVDPKHD
jgi:hypothetical protein